MPLDPNSFSMGEPIESSEIEEFQSKYRNVYIAFIQLKVGQALPLTFPMHRKADMARQTLRAQLRRICGVPKGTPVSTILRTRVDKPSASGAVTLYLEKVSNDFKSGHPIYLLAKGMNTVLESPLDGQMPKTEEIPPDLVEQMEDGFNPASFFEDS